MCAFHSNTTETTTNFRCIVMGFPSIFRSAHTDNCDRPEYPDAISDTVRLGNDKETCKLTTCR